MDFFPESLRGDIIDRIQWQKASHAFLKSCYGTEELLQVSFTHKIQF